MLPVADIEIPHMLSTWAPTGELQKQLSVTLNFPDEKSHL